MARKGRHKKRRFYGLRTLLYADGFKRFLTSLQTIVVAQNSSGVWDSNMFPHDLFGTYVRHEVWEIDGKTYVCTVAESDGMRYFNMTHPGVGGGSRGNMFSIKDDEFKSNETTPARYIPAVNEINDSDDPLSDSPIGWLDV